MITRRVAGAVGLAGALAMSLACGGADASEEGAVDDVDASVVVASDSATPQAQTLLALDGEGVRFVDATTGSTRPLPYGSEATLAITAMTAVLGPVVERGTNADCGAGPVEFVTFTRGLQIVVQSERFVGWVAVRGSADTLRTMSGIGLGSSREELERVQVANVAESTLGVEFFSGGLQGIFSSAAPDARITDFWSGVSCVAR